MFSDLSPRPSAPTVLMSWLPPAEDRLNSPINRQVWPAPALAPLDLPAALREGLLRGLLAACKQHLQRGSTRSDDDASMDSLLIWSDSNEAAWFSEAALAHQSVIWLTWLEEIEARLALRVLLAPISAFGVAQTWRAAIARQTALAKRFARIARLHDALARRLGEQQALAIFERALAACQHSA